MGWKMFKKVYSYNFVKGVLFVISLFSILLNSLIFPLSSSISYAQDEDMQVQDIQDIQTVENEQEEDEIFSEPEEVEDVEEEILEVLSDVLQTTGTPYPLSQEETVDNNSGDETTDFAVNDEEPVLEATPSPVPSPQPTPQPIIEKVCMTDEQIRDSNSGDWLVNTEEGSAQTTGNVVLGVKYIFPLEERVSLTFKCLPKEDSFKAGLSIKRIKLSDLNLSPDENAWGEYAYDITTSMPDGTFEFDLTLPKPDEVQTEVKYMESVGEEVVGIGSDKVSQEGQVVKAENINHLSIWITSVKFTDSGSDMYALFNNRERVIVNEKNASVKVSLRVGLSSGDRWRSTAWKVEGGDWVCENTPDHQDTNPFGSKFFTENFNINAQNSYSTKDVSLIAFHNNGCTGSHAQADIDDAITVVRTVTNPAVPQTCGLDISLVIDNSNSISGSDLSEMKSALINLVNSLSGTPTMFSVVKFGSSASVVRSFTSNTSSIISGINSITTGGGATNWKDALLKARGTYDPRSNKPNLIMFVSDGNPTYPDCEGSATCPADLLSAISQANTTKQYPIRILALGIGSDLDVNNLKFISGPSVNNGNVMTSDVITTDFSSLMSDLSSFATETCGGTVTVTKLVDGVPQAGWEYSTSVTGGTSNPTSAVTDSNGQVNFAINPSNGSATVSVSETNQQGYRITNAACSDSQGNVGTYDGVDSVDGIAIDHNDIISCTFNNEALPTTGSITITKDVVPDDSSTWNFTVSGSSGTFNYTLGDGQSYTFRDLPEGSYNISETMNTDYETYVTCGNVGPFKQNGFWGSVTAGQDLVCTFTNYKAPTLTVTKYIDPSTDPGRFNILVDGNEVGTDVGHGVTTNPLRVGIGYNHEVTETAGTGTDLANYTVSFGGACDSTGHVVLQAGDTENCIIYNSLNRGSVSGYKFDDTNGNGVRDCGNGDEKNGSCEPTLGGWIIFIDQNLNGQRDEGEYALGTNDNDSSWWGNYRFDNLTPGDYSICEEEQSGWVRTYPSSSNCHTVTVTAGQETGDVNFGNFQKGSVTGCKYNDLDGDGVRSGKIVESDVIEPQLSGWTIRLYDSDWTMVSEKITDPRFSFYNEMALGTYYLCEVVKPGWIQTEPGLGNNYGYSSVLNQSGDPTEGSYCKQVDVTSSGFYGSHYYGFGNTEVQLGLNLGKTNTLDGSTVKYVLAIENTGNQAVTATVYDSLPGGFSYVSGSSELDGVSIADPVVVSGRLAWTFSLIKGEKKELTFKANVSDSLGSGVYTNLAYATGVFAVLGDELDVYYTDTTETEIVSSETNLIRGISYGGALSSQVLGATTQVLGASTMLPATGAPTIVLVLSLAFLLLGLMLKSISGKNKTVKLFLITTLFTFILPGKISAVTQKIVITDLPEYTKEQSFKLSYSAIADDPSLIEVTFYVNKEGGTYSQFGNVQTGASGQIEVNSDQLNESNKKYCFKAIINGSGSFDETCTVFDNQGPDTPGEFSKERLGTTTYKIGWKTPNNNDFAQVVVYRGEEPGFEADSGHEVARQGGEKDTKYSFTDNGVDPNKEYYYTIRALDKAGNSSGLAGDAETEYEEEMSETQEVKEGESVSIISLPSEKKSEEGSVLGEEEELGIVEENKEESKGIINDTVKFVKNKTKLSLLIGGGILLLASLGLFIYKKREK